MIDPTNASVSLTSPFSSFCSTLLPPTSSTLSHLLTRGGFPAAHSDTHEPAFTALLEETRDLLTSSNFAIVLERALDRATSLLFDGLSQNVFLGKEGEEEEVRLRTASVLPGVTRWSRLALDGFPNELVDVRSLSFRIECILGVQLILTLDTQVSGRSARGGELCGDHILGLW